MVNLINKKNLSDLLLILMALIFTAAVFYILPFATNDGPVHVAFSRFLAKTGPSGDLVFQIYQKSEPIYTNLTIYLILPILMKFFTPGTAEGFIQVACLVGPPMAAYFALRQIGTDKTWLTLFIFPLCLNHLFFLGLYNFCFSVAGFFLVIGSFLRLQKTHSVFGILASVAALCFTFLSHAAGFLAAGTAIFTLTLVSCVLSFKEGKSSADVIKGHGYHAVVLAALLPLVFLLLVQGHGGTPSKYGIDVFSRVLVMLRLRVINVHSIAGMPVALALSAILSFGVVRLGMRLYKSRQYAAPKSQYGPIGALSVVIVLCLLALLFPDTLGGGWTHFERMALFPFLAAPFCLAYLPIKPRARAALSAVVTAASMAGLWMAVSAQSEVAKQLAPLAEVDRIIGRHCSVLPLIFEQKPVGKHIDYSPFFHAVNRLEFHDDRVVLFNFLARLNVYPVHFQDGHDPQEKLFGWLPQQQDTTVNAVDIAGFEKVSGLSVDYILQWGKVDAASARLRSNMQEIMQGSRLMYRSVDGRVRLFVREVDGPSRCTSRTAVGAVVMVK